MEKRNSKNKISKKIIITGAPNVGKSVLFNNLTGRYAAVSNYPGTTVEVSRGQTPVGENTAEVVDTPGIYSMRPITEEEQVARDILFKENPELVIHIIDAKNLERMLPLTLELIEGGFPVLLVLNMMDELERMKKDIDAARLEKELGVPVVCTVFTTGRGMDILKGRIEEYVQN